MKKTILAVLGFIVGYSFGTLVFPGTQVIHETREYVVSDSVGTDSVVGTDTLLWTQSWLYGKKLVP